MSTFDDWAAALRSADAATPADLCTWNGSDPTQRLAVHRNNVMVSLVDALADTFPVTQQLVGEPFFRAMAQVFVREDPPRQRVLALYGQGFPAFISAFAPAVGLPYLADLATLEVQRLTALHAADRTALTLEELRQAAQHTDALPAWRCQLAPCVQQMQSGHAVVSLWAAHQAGSGLALEDIQLAEAESAWVFREGLSVVVLPVARGQAVWMAGLQAQQPLGQAIEQALAVEPDFDFSATWALLVRYGLLVGLHVAQ